MRSRFTSFDAGAVRGVSRESALFELIYDAYRNSAVPQVVEHDPAYEQLVRLLLLEDGWDGHTAPSPSRASVDVARVVLQEAARCEGLSGPPRITADVEGGVAIYFFGGDPLPDGGVPRQAGVLINNDGEGVLYMRDRRDAGSKVEELQNDSATVKAALGRIAKFLSEG